MTPPTGYELNSIKTFLQGEIWHLITDKIWYAIKQRYQAKTSIHEKLKLAHKKTKKQKQTKKKKQ